MYMYGTVQLQLHITTRYHACQRVHHAKSSRVPRRDFVWHTSMAKSDIAMRGHAWQLIVQGCNMYVVAASLVCDCLPYLTLEMEGI